MSPLLAGLDEVTVVRTPVFDRLEEIADFVVPRTEVLVVDGDHGVGKTVLVDDVVSRHPLPATVVRLPPRQSSRDVVRSLHREIASGSDTDELTERDLQDDLVRLLAEPQIIVVRDAHRLSTEGAGQLEWLHIHPTAEWTLILEGGPGTAAAIQRDAQLRGRIASTLTVPILKDRQLLDTLQRMHPLFLGADTDLLTEIDKRVCHGVLRHWARFLQVAVHIHERAVTNGHHPPVLDRPFAKAVLAALPTTITKKRA